MMSDNNWTELNHDDISFNDEVSEEYKGFKIVLDCPNGGIISVTFFDEYEIWGCLTEAFYEDKHHDSDWHIELAKQKIDELIQERQQGQLAFL